MTKDGGRGVGFGLGADSSTASTGLSAAGAAGLGTSPPASEEITATSLQKGWRNWATYHSNMYQEDIIKYMYLSIFIHVYLFTIALPKLQDSTKHVSRPDGTSDPPVAPLDAVVVLVTQKKRWWTCKIDR